MKDKDKVSKATIFFPIVVISFAFPFWLPALWVGLDKLIFTGKMFPQVIINLSFIACVLVFLYCFFSVMSKAKMGGLTTIFFLLCYTVFATVVLFFSGWLALMEIYGP